MLASVFVLVLVAEVVESECVDVSVTELVVVVVDNDVVPEAVDVVLVVESVLVTELVLVVEGVLLVEPVLVVVADVSSPLT